MAELGLRNICRKRDAQDDAPVQEALPGRGTDWDGSALGSGQSHGAAPSLESD